MTKKDLPAIKGSAVLRVSVLKTEKPWLNLPIAANRSIAITSPPASRATRLQNTSNEHYNFLANTIRHNHNRCIKAIWIWTCIKPSKNELQSLTSTFIKSNQIQNLQTYWTKPQSYTKSNHRESYIKLNSNDLSNNWRCFYSNNSSFTQPKS